MKVFYKQHLIEPHYVYFDIEFMKAPYSLLGHLLITDDKTKPNNMPKVRHLISFAIKTRTLAFSFFFPTFSLPQN